jgi:plasmid stabilization system protein ParE
MFRITTTPTALEQIDEADAWWIEHRRDAPDAIREEIERILELLAEQPHIGVPVAGSRHAGDRKISLRRVRYDLYYRVVGDEVQILRFWHASRGTRPRL